MAYIKVYKYKKQISLDNGVTWQDVTPAEYIPSGDPIGTYDTYEECMAQYRTIQSGTTCVGVDKHNQDVYEVSYDNGVTWSVVSTSAGTLIETNSYDCGYRTRTTSGTAYCTGYDKYVDVYSQVSTDYGSTWTTTATTPTLIEADSPDCGYVPPTPASPKYVLTLQDSSTVSAECDSTSSITYNEVSVNYSNTLVSAEIGDCVTSISNYSFFNCSSLTSVTIPNSVTSIETAFISCSGLTNIDIPNSVTSIGGYAFEQCTSLSSCTIGSGVANIGDRAFYNCSSLTSIAIPSGVTSIGQYAFNGCTSLTSITIQSTTPSTLGSYAFDNTNNCPIYVPCESVNAYKTAWSAYANRITCIKLILILSNKNTVTIPSDSSSAVTRNDVSAYSASVVSAVIGGCVTSISSNAFKGCEYLANVNIPSGVTSIENYAFSGCTGLTCVASMPSTPPILGTNVFASTNDCPIYVGNVVNAYKAASGWSEYSSRIKNGSVTPSGLRGKWSLKVTSGSTTVTVTAPCESNSAITSSEVIEYKDNSKGITVGTCAKEIDSYAFRDFTGLTEAIIGTNVTNIGNEAFKNCSQLNYIRSYPRAKVPVIGIGVFDNTNNCPIIVPLNKFDEYRLASGWIEYASRMQIYPN